MTNIETPQILAPAGSFASLRAALDAGCDEVYFGITDFNMRATASSNFTPQDLSEIVSLCEAKNVQTCLTVNTLLYDGDLERMRKTVDAAYEAGVTAIIAADMATVLYIQEKNKKGLGEIFAGDQSQKDADSKKRKNPLETHISTQLSVSNIESVKFYSQWSDRVVLARELTLEQVAEIVHQIKDQDIRGPKGNLVEIEVFAHGALCVSVSGRCAMSLYFHDRSANRGQCAHVCRRKFRVTDVSSGKSMDVDNNYIMSSADLCTIGFLPELVAAGVKVLKFEGRGRSPEYVQTVIGCYREALDEIKKWKEKGSLEGVAAKVFPKNWDQKVEGWNKRLGTVFNRGLSKGFYMGRQLDEWAGVPGSKATQKKLELGKVEKYYPKIKVAQILIQTPEDIKIGDEILIIGQKTGLVKHELQEMFLDGKKVKKAQQGQTITFEVNSRVKDGDLVYVVRER